MYNIKGTKDNPTFNGIYIKSVIVGFCGTGSVGRKMLKNMGLPNDAPPFDIYSFISNGKAHWKDCDGNIAYISFNVKDDKIICFGYYLGNKRTKIIFNSLNSKSTTMSARYASRDIGESCMLCIYEEWTKEYKRLYR